MFLFFQMGLRVVKTCLAFPILDLMILFKECQEINEKREGQG